MMQFVEGDASTNAPTIRAMLDDAAGAGAVASGGEHGASSPASHASHKVEAGQGEGMVGASQALPSPGRAASGSLQVRVFAFISSDSQLSESRPTVHADPVTVVGGWPHLTSTCRRFRTCRGRASIHPASS